MERDLDHLFFLAEFALVGPLSQFTGAESVCATVVEYLDATVLADVLAREWLVSIFFTNDAYGHGQKHQKIFQIFFRIIHYDFINEFHSTELYIPFNYALYRFVFYIRTINGGIALNAHYEILADAFGFGQHQDMTGM
jgi:hypothetical protein